MDEDEAWGVLEAERLAFADLLDGLSAEQWQTQSLCESWTVAGVTTHMMVGQTGSLPRFLTAMVRARGRFARANEVLVERKLDRPTSAIVADLRDHAGHRFSPPGLDWRAPLTDFLVHRLDVCVPLGLVHGRSLDPWTDGLDQLLSPKAVGSFVDRGLPALAYAATDIGWRHGSGPEVGGPAEALALAITRRPTVRLDELAGPGADVLRGWARRTTA